MEPNLVNKFIKDTVKLLRGTDAVTTCAELAELADADPVFKEEIVVISVTAASSSRVNVDNLDANMMEHVRGDLAKRFRVNNKWNFSKLACIGHCILEVSGGGRLKEIQDGMQNRIGGISIFSMNVDKLTVSEKRAGILKDNRKKWGEVNVKQVMVFLEDTQFK